VQDLIDSNSFTHYFSFSYYAGIEVATTIDSDERGGRAEIIHVRVVKSCSVN
jgi:hypothetical protein